MGQSAAAGSELDLRRLALLSILFAVASVLATVEALKLLPYAGSSGQWIVVAIGAAVSVLAFAFGMLISMRKALARTIGFATIVAAILTAALFSLLAFVVPESAWAFAAWTIVVLAYAGVATRGLVRWPTADVRERPKSHLGLFISYRRVDSRETVGRIHDHLQDEFEEQHLFLDVDSQAPGEDYRVVIGKALTRADVLIAVMGPQWLSVTDDDGRRRLDDPEDMVRIELETALRFNLRVIPVLVEGSSMPAAEDVPASLQPLCYKTAVQVRPDPDFKTDMQGLIAAVRR